jgi:hypothetical protein
MTLALHDDVAACPLPGLADPPPPRRRHDRQRPPLELVTCNPPAPPIEITDYNSLHAMLRARAEALNISRETIDHITGLQPGMSSKLLSLNQIRRLGLMSLGPMLNALCVKLIAVPDDEAFARNKSRYVKRDDAHYRSARQGHDGKAARKFKKISGTVTATFGGAVRYVAPMQFENLSGAVTAKLGHR